MDKDQKEFNLEIIELVTKCEAIFSTGPRDGDSFFAFNMLVSKGVSPAEAKGFIAGLVMMLIKNEKDTTNIDKEATTQ